MKILVIGSGGREHTLTWKLKQSSKVKEIFCAPGNGGISEAATCVDIKADDIEGLKDFALKNKIDLTIVGPEVPLVAGIVDTFEEAGLLIFGPSRYAAKLEGSKVFAKEFMQRHQIPTAAFKNFTDFQEASAHIKGCTYPLVIKADGLAAGKGVMICLTREEAEDALKQIMKERVFKEAGDMVIVEECLEGEEASILTVSDGTNFIVLESSQDHKRIFDNDCGANTGGMGAYSPAPVVTSQLMKNVAESIIEPTIKGMNEEGALFKGVLYVGLMITKKGPYVLEYNVRFGDPEIQAVIPRLKSDLADIILASCKGTLNHIQVQWDSGACLCVVMSSGGYPGSYKKGKEIKGLDSVAGDSRTIVFHAGTKKENDKIVTSGGRVLGVTSLGKDIEDAIHNAYNSVSKIGFEGCYFRKDIGQKALSRLQQSA